MDKRCHQSHFLSLISRPFDYLDARMIITTMEMMTIMVTGTTNVNDDANIQLLIVKVKSLKIE